MDYIYSKLNNNLVDINRLDTITLLKCEEDDSPIEGLKIGDYYLKFTVVDSDKVNYCNLSSLNQDDKDLLDRIINDEKTFDERITADEEYFGERCLYRSEKNASKWESKEGSFTGYLGNSSETAVKAKIGLNIESSSPYLPSYPTISGTYYVLADENNSLTGKLNLTPINSNASPLLSFSGTGNVAIGQRNIYLHSDWFKTSTDNINLCIPATSGTLITEADAMGSLDIEVEDLNPTQLEITDAQYNYLSKYPKAMFALKQSSWSTSFYKYFIKAQEGLFISFDSTGKKITYASLALATPSALLTFTDIDLSNKEDIEEVKKYTDEKVSHLTEVVLRSW